MLSFPFNALFTGVYPIISHFYFRPIAKKLFITMMELFNIFSAIMQEFFSVSLHSSTNPNIKLIYLRES